MLAMLRLQRLSLRTSVVVCLGMTYLETLVLQNPFDGRVFTTGHHLGLEDDTKRPISDNLTLCVGDLLHLSG